MKFGSSQSSNICSSVNSVRRNVASLHATQYGEIVSNSTLPSPRQTTLRLPYCYIVYLHPNPQHHLQLDLIRHARPTHPLNITFNTLLHCIRRLLNQSRNRR